MCARAPGKTVIEPAREIKVCREVDVVVVGGGPGGKGTATWEAWQPEGW
jgi:ribulose 1,5-bisphosphate synthetase/thiazole synthase